MTTTPTSIPVPDVDPAADYIQVPSRIEYVVRAELQHSEPAEFDTDAEHLARVMAFALARDYAAAGITATVTAFRRVWVLAEETELPTATPEPKAGGS